MLIESCFSRMLICKQKLACHEEKRPENLTLCVQRLNQHFVHDACNVFGVLGMASSYTNYRMFVLSWAALILFREIGEWLRYYKFLCSTLATIKSLNKYL